MGKFGEMNLPFLWNKNDYKYKIKIKYWELKIKILSYGKNIKYNKSINLFFTQTLYQHAFFFKNSTRLFVISDIPNGAKIARKAYLDIRFTV